jgi:hypothetical protein
MCKVARHSGDALELHNVPTVAKLLFQEYGLNYRRSLQTTISMFSGAYCHDPRDRIYGLMDSSLKRNALLSTTEIWYMRFTQNWW